MECSRGITERTRGKVRESYGAPERSKISNASGLEKILGLRTKEVFLKERKKTELVRRSSSLGAPKCCSSDIALFPCLARVEVHDEERKEEP